MLERALRSSTSTHIHTYAYTYIYLRSAPHPTHIYIDIHIYTYNVYVCVYIYIYMYIYLCISMDIVLQKNKSNIHICMYIHIDIYTYIYIYTHIYMYTYVCVCIYVYIYTYIYTHTTIYIYIYGGGEKKNEKKKPIAATLGSCFAISRAACGSSAAPESPPRSRLRNSGEKTLLFGPLSSLVLPFSPADALLFPLPVFVCRVHARLAQHALRARARAWEKKKTKTGCETLKRHLAGHFPALYPRFHRRTP